jgi:hypothetical protein
VRPLKAQSGKGLTACPAESEAPGAEINYPLKNCFFTILSQNLLNHSTNFVFCFT